MNVEMTGKQAFKVLELIRTEQANLRLAKNRVPEWQKVIIDSNLELIGSVADQLLPLVQEFIDSTVTLSELPLDLIVNRH